MATLDATASCSSSASNLQHSSSKIPQLSPSVTRLWRPAAQRNLRNQWSKLASYRQQWASSSSKGRSHATDLVNAYLSQRYMPAMELGVLSDMPNIRKKACMKLFKQQGLHGSKLLSAYKDMVTVMTHMVNTSRSMRCFLKGTSSSPLVQFSSLSEDTNDLGDGGGVPVFLFWPVSSFEKLAEELVQMFIIELNLKRLLVVELLFISCEEAPHGNQYRCSDELYPGEFDDLGLCSIHSKEIGELIPPKIIGFESHSPVLRPNQEPDHEILQVYLTTWLAEVNIDTYRYEQAEFIEREMEQMTEQIKSIIQMLNANQGGELDVMDGMTPLDVIVRILNNQLSSLMWIDEKAEEFNSRIQKLANQGSTAEHGSPSRPKF